MVPVRPVLPPVLPPELPPPADPKVTVLSTVFRAPKKALEGAVNCEQVCKLGSSGVTGRAGQCPVATGGI